MSLTAPRPAPPKPRVFSPYQLNDLVDRALADNLAPLWIEGELADVSERGGHVYFSLRDPNASVRGVIFSSDVRRVRHLFVDGHSVRLKVVVGLYVPRGQFQIRAMVALPAGAGDRAAEVARIRAKLKEEGLLDPARKRPLPRWPQQVGIVTSKSGAALHDIAEVARGRMPVRLLLAHATVQGLDAPQSIVAALGRLSRTPGIEVILLARGGGAQDDLSAFDDERVARAIAGCPVPVVSGVGHEVDITTADLVADLRAATPSHAAELAIPTRETYLRELERARVRIERATRQKLVAFWQQTERASARLRDPRQLLLRQQAQLEQLRARVDRSIQRRLTQETRSLEEARARLAESEPRARLVRSQAEVLALALRVKRSALAHHERAQQRVADVRGRLTRAALATPMHKRGLLAQRAARLAALSPLGVLARGYAIALHEPSGRALLKASDAQPHDQITVRLSEGALRAEVISVLDEG